MREHFQRVTCAACGAVIVESGDERACQVQDGHARAWDACDACLEPVAAAITARWGTRCLLLRDRLEGRVNDVRAHGLSYAEHLR